MPSGTAGKRRVGPIDAARTLLALLAIAPGLVAGLAVFVFTRDRRRGVNRAIELWGDLGTAAAGMRLEIAGAEHLERRPAVFVLNHQSGVDPILVCALLRRDFVGVAKQEIRRNPVLGPAFAFVGTVFLDRFDSARALEVLKPAVDVLRGGTSMAFMPEGTRSANGRLGPFKKGAFRLAMAAKVPIVPIVIANARDVLPRGAWLMKAATVRVRVQPPVSTGDWTLEDLDAKIDAVRALFERVLAADAAEHAAARSDGAVSNSLRRR